MKTKLTLLSAFVLLSVGSASAAMRYVDANTANPTPPYTNWATAARVIQDAVDAASPGDEIVVTNGVYATGGRAISGLLTNRVAVDKPLTLRSVNGPQVTVIQGYQLPGAERGCADGAIRCVYLTDGARLVGFTLTNGATRAVAYSEFPIREGGGVWCESTNAVVSNCVLAGNSAYLAGGGAFGGTLNDCTVIGNSANYGGGVCGSESPLGGGAYRATLNRCKLTANSASSSGGGAFGGILNNCTLSANSVEASVWTRGGGAADCDLHNCVLTGNSAGWGGGAAGSTLNNCTLTGNLASADGGGASGSTLNNCIVYFNAARQSPNYAADPWTPVLMNYCSTTPLPTNGVGNVSLDPQLASASLLSATSPCRGAGSPAYTNVAVGFPVELTAVIEGRTTASMWEFGDGVTLSNSPSASHAWGAAGDFEVVLRVYNESQPASVNARVTIHISNGVYCVSAESATPIAPYISWATAAKNIQDAVDIAVPGAMVLVSNGVYASGGRAVDGTMTNRVAVTKPLTVRSVNGPQSTVIQGYQVPGTTNGDEAIRCVYLTNRATLYGFVLTNGATQLNGSVRSENGGGVFCEWSSGIISNCVIVGNSAGFQGGGASGGTLKDCTLTGNSAGDGGGAANSALDNCLLTGNVARFGGGAAIGGSLNNCTLAKNQVTGTNEWNGGGGAFSGTLNNCIVYFNTAARGANYLQFDRPLNNCCTTPFPTNGVGNITNAPLFVDYAAGNLRLQSNSPCINAGLNAYAPGAEDLDGLPRIVSGTVDIGAYEYQGPGSVISYAWLRQYGLPTDGSVDFTDPDRDGHTTWQEWRCQTDPTNALSALRLLSATPDGANVRVRWQSVAGVDYSLERSADLLSSPQFVPVASGIPGQPGTTAFTDTNAPGSGPFFYRVGVGN